MRETPEIRKMLDKAASEGRVKEGVRTRLPGLSAPPADISEADFQTRVIELAQSCGWRCAHFRAVRVQRADGSFHYETPVQADGKGWPDLFCCRGDRAMGLELKVGYNKPTQEQTHWLTRLAMAGIAAHVIRPSDWAKLEALLA